MTNKPIDQQATSNDTSATSSVYYLHARPEILQLVPITATKILDVGCGAGVLGASIKSRQIAEVHGVELTSDAASKAEALLDRVWNRPVESVLSELNDGYYDCIVAADVLEHVVDPWDTLIRLKEKLAPDGKIVVSLPNVQNWGVVSGLLEGKWDYRSEGILDRTHLHFFTRKSIEELFWNAGFHIVQMGTTINGPPLPSNLADSLRKSGLETGTLERDAETFQFLVVAEKPKHTTTPRIAVIILNWNGKEDTLECLASVGQLNYPNYEIIVVDNGSTDNSVDAIATQYPDIALLQTGANLGYAGGNNIGIQCALNNHADYILLLNNDTTIDSKLLSAFVEAAQAIPDAGVFGGKIYYYDQPDTLWFAGGHWLKDDMRLEHIGYGEKDGVEFDQYRACDYITGCALFAGADVFRKVGLLDEKFFLTYEETDWCYRARNNGYRCIVVPGAKLWHKVSASFGGPASPLVTYFMTRNKLLWAKRHCSPAERRTINLEARQLARSILIPPFVVSANNKPISKRIVWSIASWWKNVRVNLSQPTNIAILYGLRDFWLRRFGDCPRKVRDLARGTPRGK